MAYSTIILLSFVSVLIADVVVRINSFIGVSNGSTALVLALNLISVVGLLLFAVKVPWKSVMPSNALLIYKLLMAWSLFSLILGGFNAQDYCDWKALLLDYFFVFLVPLAIVVGLNYKISIKIFKFILDKLLSLIHISEPTRPY